MVTFEPSLVIKSSPVVPLMTVSLMVVLVLLSPLITVWVKVPLESTMLRVELAPSTIVIEPEPTVKMTFEPSDCAAEIEPLVI